MSFATRPPGDPARHAPTPAVPPAPASPAVPGAVAPTSAIAAASDATATIGARPAMLEAAGALRVFVEEVRAGVQAQLSGGARVAALPPLPDADPGNAAAALLRWLRAASGAAALPPPALREIVERAYARVDATLPRPPSAGVVAGADPGAMRPGAPVTRAPVTGAPRDDAPAALRAEVAVVRDVLAASRDLVVRGLTSPSPATAPRVDATEMLRRLVDEVGVQLRESVGATRMPSAPPPIVTDARGSSLGPALLRWLTGALAEKGAPLSALQDAIRAAYARTLAGVPEAAADSPDAGIVAQVREALAAVREHVLLGLGGAPERADRALPRSDAPSARVDARAEPDVPDARGVPVGGALVVADDAATRTDRAGGRAGTVARTDDAASDDAAAPDAPASGDLQGPMDCVRRYFDAYLSGDSAAYAQQWVYPACVWSDGRWSAYDDPAACAAGNDRYTAALRAQGVVGGRIVMLRVEPTADDAAVVHGVFTRERADGSVHSEVEAAYTTVRTGHGWRVAVCIVKKPAA